MRKDYKNRALEKKIRSFMPLAEEMPAVVIIQQLEPFQSIYMNSNGLEGLGITLEELRDIGTDYLKQFFNLDDTEEYLSKLNLLLSSCNVRDSFSFLQQVRLKDRAEWVWHIGSTRIFFQDDEGRPTHLITTVIPIDELKHIPKKAERMLAESDFIRNNLTKFLSLSSREREILQLVGSGKSSSEIATLLFISAETVNSHRKNIKMKLGISSIYEFTQYAQAYDLL